MMDQNWCSPSAEYARGTNFFPDPDKIGVHTNVIIRNTDIKNIICGFFTKELHESIHQLFPVNKTNDIKTTWLNIGKNNEIINEILVGITNVELKVPDKIKVKCLSNIKQSEGNR